MRAALSKVEGVASVDVDFEAKTASVTMQPGKTLTREACDQAFEGSRYSVKSFDAAPPA